MCSLGIDIFDYKMLYLPLRYKGETSLFVVVGAENITTPHGSDSDGPCIIHLDPNGNKSFHRYSHITDKIRHWLNTMSRKEKSMRLDHTSIPFNKNTMPVKRPRGESCLLVLLISFAKNCCSNLSFPNSPVRFPEV